MKMDPAALYQQLGQLIAAMPDLMNDDWNTPAGRRWLGRAAALIEAGGNGTDSAVFNVSSNGLGTVLHVQNVQAIISVIHRALARAELAAPASVQGAFLPVGEPFAAFAAVGKVLGGATATALIVDPYADQNILTEFAVLAPEGVRVMILADEESHKPALRPAAANWAKQYGPGRPLQVRLAPPKSLHDRVIIVDDREVWAVGQSFNALAKRAPTSLVRVVDPETVNMKVDAYAAMWATATALV